MYYLEIRLKNSELFPTLSHLNGDGGMLTGLRMLKTPKSPRQRTQMSAAIQHSTPNPIPINWHERFVAFPENSQDLSPRKFSEPLHPAPHVRRLARANAANFQLYGRSKTLM